MNKYYPDFYLKRRQKHQAYLRVTVTVALIAVIGLGALAGVYIFKNFLAPRRMDPKPNPVMAKEQHDLKTDEKLRNAPDSAPLGDAEVQDLTASAPTVDPKSLEYAESFPTIAVSLAGMPTASAAPVDPAVLGTPPEQPSGSDTAASEQLDGAGGTDSTGSSENVSESPDPKQPAEKPATAVTPTVKKPESKPASETKTEKKDPRPTAKDETDKPKPAEKPKPEPKQPVADKPAGKTEFRVYAGKFLSREEAEAGRSDLAAVGLSGSIIDTKAGDYLLLVGTVDDYDGATALKGKLSSSGFGGAFVTKKSK